MPTNRQVKGILMYYGMSSNDAYHMSRDIVNFITTSAIDEQDVVEFLQGIGDLPSRPEYIIDDIIYLLRNQAAEAQKTDRAKQPPQRQQRQQPPQRQQPQQQRQQPQQWQQQRQQREQHREESLLDNILTEIEEGRKEKLAITEELSDMDIRELNDLGYTAKKNRLYTQISRFTLSKMVQDLRKRLQGTESIAWPYHYPIDYEQLEEYFLIVQRTISFHPVDTIDTVIENLKHDEKVIAHGLTAQIVNQLEATGHRVVRGQASFTIIKPDPEWVKRDILAHFESSVAPYICIYSMPPGLIRYLERLGFRVQPDALQVDMVALRSRRKCLNDSSIMGDPSIGIPEDLLYVSGSGHCFNIQEDLLPHLMSGNTDNPYTRAPLFRTQAEMDEILNHPGLTTTERQHLRARLLSPLLEAETRVITVYPAVFASIYHAGIRCRGDYTEHFTVASEALGLLKEALDALPVADKEVFMQMKMKRYTVASVLAESGNACIHAVGSTLLMIYMHYWHLLPVALRPDLPPGAIQMDQDPDLPEEAQRYAKLIMYFIGDVCRVSLFIFDGRSNGLYNYYGECLIIDARRRVEIKHLMGEDSSVPDIYQEQHKVIHRAIARKYSGHADTLYNMAVAMRRT